MRAACLCLVAVSGVMAAAAHPQSQSSNSLEERGSRGAGLGSAMLGEIARELITRSASSSQVLSLNLTNLVILLVLKAIIFGAGSMGLGWAGAGKSASLRASGAGYGLGEHGHGGHGGQGHGQGLVSEHEALLLLGFLMGSERDGYRCLNRVACQDPDTATSYAKAGMLLAKGAKLLSGVIPYDDKYEDIANGLAEALDYGRSGQLCEERYSCAR